MRQKSLAVIGCALAVFLVSSSEAHAQRRHMRARHVTVIRTSPLLFGHGFYDPFFFGYGYGPWFPPPVFYPAAGFYGPDREVAVRLQVTPRDATVYVDGFAAGVVDDFDGVFQRLRLVPGHHEIVIYLPGYRSLRQNLYFNPGSTHTIRYTLEPLAPGESLEPPPVPRAFPPGPGTPPSPRAPGADRDERPGESPGLGAQRLGTLALRVQPADAEVFIDGEPWKGPAGQDRMTIELLEGPHHVRVQKPGLQPFEVDVEVRAGETASFNVTLR